MRNQLQTRNQKSLIKDQSLFLNIFWVGFIIFQIAGTLETPGNLNIKILQAFQGLGLILIFTSVIKLKLFKIENTYLRVIFTIYMIWLVIVIARGIEFPPSYDFIKTTLITGGGNDGLVYIAPLIILFPRNAIFYKKLFDVIIFFGVIYLMLDVMFIKNLLHSGEDKLSLGIVEALSGLSIPVAFILLTYLYHSNKKNLLAIGIILITLLFAIIRARRGLIIITSSVIIFSFLLYFFHSKRKIITIYLVILITVLGILYASNIYNINNSKIFSLLVERGTEDTRTGVELYFYDDMKEIDWIIGRGMGGEYYCPDITGDQITNYRNLIETGYLQIILKGGIISLGLLLLMIIPAFIKGIFFSKNLLSTAAGIWILVFMISSYPAIQTWFSLNYFLVWISIGVCFSKKIRNMTDDEIKFELQSAKKI